MSSSTVLFRYKSEASNEIGKLFLNQVGSAPMTKFVFIDPEAKIFTDPCLFPEDDTNSFLNQSLK